MPEDDSTSDCINSSVECLCLDLVAEAVHSDSFTFIYLSIILLNSFIK